MCFLKSLIYYTRTFLAAAIICGGSVFGVVAGIVCTAIGKQHLAQWATARCFYYSMALFFGIDVRVENEQYLQDLPCIIVANHQSALDIFMLGRMFPRGCTVTAKKSLKYMPFLGWFMALSGTLFLERNNRAKSVDTLNRGLQNIKQKKRALWIFPEGTRSYTTKLEMLPFKKGAFHLAQQGELPIVPIVVSNTSTLMNPKLKIYNRGYISARVLKPISTVGLKKEDVGALCEKVRNMMVEELQDVGYSPAINDTGLPVEAIEYEKRRQYADHQDVSEVLSSENSTERVTDSVKEF